MCRYCAGECSHVGDSDRLEWRETDLWPSPADLAKGRDAPSASRRTTQSAPQGRPRTTRPPTPFAGIRTPIPTNRDGGDRP